MAEQKTTTLSAELEQLKKGACSYFLIVDDIIGKLKSVLETGGLNDANKQIILETITIIQFLTIIVVCWFFILRERKHKQIIQELAQQIHST